MSAKTAPGPACRGMSTAQGCTERAEECTHAEGLGMVVAATDDKRVNMLADMSNRKRIQETLARAFDWYATAVDARLRQRQTGARSFALLRRRGLMKACGEWSKFLEQVKMWKKELPKPRHDTSPAPALSQGISSPRQSRGKSGGCWPQCFRWLAATKTSARRSLNRDLSKKLYFAGHG